ncbi:purine/pyrimidine permease [Kroppenstedtia eburnea]|uniref:purine/pyrimidine permease n=1 Tax=Kroppenstedtia eburnea TaxID=714067 RepID=UPI0036335297
MQRLKGQTALGSLQWFVFLLSSSLAIPIVIGQTFHLSAQETAELMQRTFFVVGIASFLQGWLGHRLPIADGPAGVWLGIFVILGETAGTEPGAMLQSLEGGMLVAGLVLLLMGITRFIRRMMALFTPLVTGVYLLLLVFQLSGVFLKGMLGVDADGLDPVSALLSFGVLILIILISVKGKGSLRNYSVLLGILVGWAAFAWMGLAPGSPHSGGWIRLPELFAWGTPRLEGGMVITGVLIALVLMSNLVATVATGEQVTGRRPEEGRGALDRGGIWNGAANGLAALFSAVGTIPLSSSAGFVRLTGLKQLRPFLIGCLVLVGVSLFPPLMGFLAGLPEPVADAALLATFVQIVSIAVGNITREPLDDRRNMILGISLMIGVGIMFVPSDAFASLPSILRFTLGNGLLTGTFTAILMERLWSPKKE